MYFIIVNAHSKCPELFEMSSVSAEQTVFTLRNLFTSYGLLLQYISDNGPQCLYSHFEQSISEWNQTHLKCTLSALIKWAS